MSGFAVRLTPHVKSFVLDRRINGRMRRITLGHYGDLTVDQARNIAQQMGGAIAKGEDPAQVKIDKKREATFRYLEEQYL